MVIYTNNFAEKLFGFAMSREQLRTTGLCEILENPNLQLDIDLAIDFNAAVRGNEDAAEIFTNTFILSSAYLDYSTVDFYTNRMQHYPIFDYHINRIEYIFNNIDYTGQFSDYYAGTSARDRGFIDSLRDALTDCLNSPCNLFAASSEDMASIIDKVAASNSTSAFSFSGFSALVKTTYGGIKNTLIKQIPDALQGMIGEMSIMGVDAFNQSIDMLFEKDQDKKEEIIANALEGNALDKDASGYSYTPDIESFTSIEGFASTVLSQAASDLGGCFRKYQHIARYSRYDEEQNTSRTSNNPVQDSVDGENYNRTSGGAIQWGEECDESQPNFTGPSFEPKTTVYSPQRNDSPLVKMEGSYLSSISGPDGKNLVRTLDDVAANRSSYITLAGDPSQYGQKYKIPSITYINNSGKTVTLKNVTGVVHDTGDAFKGVGNTSFDIPVGRDYTDSQMNSQPFQNKVEFQKES